LVVVLRFAECKNADDTFHTTDVKGQNRTSRSNPPNQTHVQMKRNFNKLT